MFNTSGLNFSMKGWATSLSNLAKWFSCSLKVLKSYVICIRPDAAIFQASFDKERPPRKSPAQSNPGQGWPCLRSLAKAFVYKRTDVPAHMEKVVCSLSHNAGSSKEYDGPPTQIYTGFIDRNIVSETLNTNSQPNFYLNVVKTANNTCIINHNKVARYYTPEVACVDSLILIHTVSTKKVEAKPEIQQGEKTELLLISEKIVLFG